ncbi:MAG: lasso peptide biosynthesis B2 protein [Acidobacteria bacterium]|nr:lasso peptide biosynthesis B2 protein [Acidobacteriota bacterium]
MGKRWRRALRFLRRPAREKTLLFESLTLLAWSRLQVRTVPFRWIGKRLGQMHVECFEAVDGAAMGRAREIAWAVNAAATHTWWTSNCLPRAMTAQRMLARRGLPSTVYLGAAKEDPETMIAHAWLRCGDAMLTGGPGHRRYTVVATFANYADDHRWPRGLHHAA